MNTGWLNSFWRSPVPWAAFAGLLLAGAFPLFNLAGLAWVAPGAILYCALWRPGQALRIGFVAGLCYYLASLYWLLMIPVAWAPIGAWLALSAYCALFVAAWTWLCVRISPIQLHAPAGHVPLVPPTPALSFSWPMGATGGWAARAGWALGCAATWVAMEMILARLFTGFPWNLLGASQYQQLPLIQVASVAGIYSVSFLLVWFSAGLVCAAAVFREQPGTGWRWMRELMLPLLVIAVVISAGFSKVLRAEKPERHLRVALIQPSIPQTLIWNPNAGAERFRKMLQLSELALASKHDLLVWPEAAVPSLFRYHPETLAAVTNLARQHECWMIIGADDAEPKRHGTGAEYFNSSFLISPAGDLLAKYDKYRLVIFGEYIPLVRWFPFIRHLTPITGSFTPGTVPTDFHLAEPRAKTSVLICFEDIFPHLARRYVDEDTDFLLNLTNNGWFGESAAQWQHAVSAVFRAVENGLPLVRCANNGLTCWVDARGGLREIFLDESGDIYGEGFKLANIPLLPLGERREPTIYNRYGDWFGWLCVGVTTVQLVRVLLARRRVRQVNPGK